MDMYIRPLTGGEVRVTVPGKESDYKPVRASEITNLKGDEE
ncbi:hypothetical protein [Cytobacillus stercorigallinarum]|nr:hypothetical protein [Cytobacillus stercorigallinarum]